MEKCLSDWSATSSRIIRARFVTSKARLTVICAYAPTLASSDKSHNEFYNTLESELAKIPVHYMILVLGDFNAHIGTSRMNFHRILGRFSHPSPRNDSGDRLLDLCQRNHLVITNTFFVASRVWSAG